MVLEVPHGQMEHYQQFLKQVYSFTLNSKIEKKKIKNDEVNNNLRYKDKIKEGDTKGK
jgi:hypothetical protein